MRECEETVHKAVILVAFAIVGPPLGMGLYQIFVWVFGLPPLEPMLPF